MLVEKCNGSYLHFFSRSPFETLTWWLCEFCNMGKDINVFPTSVVFKQPAQPHIPLTQTAQPHIPLTQPAQPHIPLTQTAQSHIPLTQTAQSHIPLTQPAQPHIPLTQPAQPHIPLTQPAQPHIPLTQPAQPHFPFTQPAQPYIPLTQPAQSKIPLPPINPTPSFIPLCHFHSVFRVNCEVQVWKVYHFEVCYDTPANRPLVYPSQSGTYRDEGCVARGYW